MLTSSSRKFGIEIEAFGISTSLVASELTAAGIPTIFMGYTHTTTAHWKVVTDVSIQGHQSFELVSPILQGADGFAQIAKVCTVLTRLGAKVNKSCGLHVHADGRDFSTNLPALKRLSKLFLKHEKNFDSVVVPSRRKNNNSMIQSNLSRHSTLKDAFQKIDSATTLDSLISIVCPGNGTYREAGRYHKLNLVAMLRHGTVEFRQHGGSIDATKISNWVAYLLDFTDWAYNNKNVGTSTAWKWFLSATKNTEIQDFLSARRTAFNERYPNA
jgi:hypothetical protein